MPHAKGPGTYGDGPGRVRVLNPEGRVRPRPEGAEAPRFFVRNAADNEGATPLHLAAKLKRKEAIEVLLSKGADLKARDKSGKTPVDWAEDEATKQLFDGSAGKRDE